MELAADANAEERKRKFLAKFEKDDIFNKYLISQELINQRKEWKLSGKEHEPIIYWLLEEKDPALKICISDFYLTLKSEHLRSDLEEHKERYLKVLEPCIDISYIVKDICVGIGCLFYIYTRQMTNEGILSRTPMICMKNVRKEGVYLAFLKKIKYLSGLKADFPEKSSVKEIYDYLIQSEDKKLTDDEWKNIAWHAVGMAVERKLVKVPGRDPMFLLKGGEMLIREEE